MGIEISEVIKKEHFDIAVKKVSMGNSITSIKNIQRINFIDIFEAINQVDDILKQDPANVYENMDYKTKIYYRNKIQEISKKTKISEIYIAKKCLELAVEKQGKEAHIGYYLIDSGKKELMESLLNRKINTVTTKQKLTMYLIIKVLISLGLSILFGAYVFSQTRSIILFILSTVLLYLPIEIIFMQILQYVLSLPSAFPLARPAG